MATFAYSEIYCYLGSGDGATLFDSQTFSGTLSDGDPDTTFEAGDTVSGFRSDGTPVSVAYLGTTEIDGQNWPVFYHAGSDQTSVYVSITPVNLPMSLQVAENATLTVCFHPATAIATPKGAVAVERIAIGDLVLTADGRAVPVKWLGRQTLAPMFQRVRLVRIAAGALGAGLPLRDLVVTADHALMIDGLMVTAGALVNGTSITAETDLPERITVYHVETEDHDIILAEGAPAETFIDYTGRRAFDNYAEYVALYGEDRALSENPAPRITAARQLPAALKARLGIAQAA